MEIVVLPVGLLSLFFLPALFFGAAFTVLGLILFFPVLLLWLWLVARVCRKAGFSGWWALTSLFPPLLAIMIWVLAFTDWPLGPRMEVLPPRRW